MNITVFWDVVPCSLGYYATDVSEETSASIFMSVELATQKYIKEANSSLGLPIAPKMEAV
jgi:hypothetical protein